MTLHEAYLKAKSHARTRGLTRFVTCGDYGDFWGFCFQYEEDGVDGIGDTTVNKKTGAIGHFIPPMDLDLFAKRKPIPVEQFAEYNVAI